MLKSEKANGRCHSEELGVNGRRGQIVDDDVG
jgi:hypothetical protein